MTTASLKTRLESFALTCRECIAKGNLRPRFPDELREELARTGRANLTGANLTDADLTGADLTGAYLTDADLTRADLTGANLADANLTDADLTDADLTRADLTRANLADAYLTRANLTGAYLTDADLTGAYLSGANLTDADLTGANLADANLTDADLTRASLTGAYLTGANLTGANLADAYLEEPRLRKQTRAEWLANRASTDAQRASRYRDAHPDVPVVAHLDAKILHAIEHRGGSLEMSQWHTCATTHCRAGWAITLAGDPGRALEARLGPSRAGAAIYRASTGRVPWFYATNEAALADIRVCAAADPAEVAK